MKYLLVDEDDRAFYFKSLAEAGRFLGVTAQEVRNAIEKGCVVAGYTADEVIL